jgi:peptidoglycan/LPS O-acetylase OafA/YrhL
MERRYDIDWLRMLAILAVFLFHCARFFGGGDWHLMNKNESMVATIFIGVLDIWIMPLFFLLSGAGSWYALRSRGPGAYLLDRVKRLLVPLYITGVFVFIPPQAYFEYVTHEGFAGTLLNFYPTYLRNIVSGVDFGSPLFINIFYGHLWFLQFLFLISLVMLPLLLLLKSERGLHFIARLAGICSRRGGIFIFLIPLTLIRIGLTHITGGEHGWEDFLTFSVYFLIGYIMVADRRFAEGFVRHMWPLLALGLICFGGEANFIFLLEYNYANIHHPGGETFSLLYVLFQIIMSTGTLSWVLFILGVGNRYLSFNHRVLAYGNEAVLPFYIFHQTVILCVGWFVIGWNMGIFAKYTIIAVISFISIMILYEFLVRRFNVVRFSFGMRPKRDNSQKT